MRPWSGIGVAEWSKSDDEANAGRILADSFGLAGSGQPHSAGILDAERDTKWIRLQP